MSSAAGVNGNVSGQTSSKIMLKQDNVQRTRSLSNAIYTVRHKKLHPSYWYNNFAILCHTVMIFGIGP